MGNDPNPTPDSQAGRFGNLSIRPTRRDAGAIPDPLRHLAFHVLAPIHLRHRDDRCPLVRGPGTRIPMRGSNELDRCVRLRNQTAILHHHPNGAAVDRLHPGETDGTGLCHHDPLRSESSEVRRTDHPSDSKGPLVERTPKAVPHSIASDPGNRHRTVIHSDQRDALPTVIHRSKPTLDGRDPTLDRNDGETTTNQTRLTMLRGTRAENDENPCTKQGFSVRTPAATYSPRGSLPKYHRRWRA